MARTKNSVPPVYFSKKSKYKDYFIVCGDQFNSPAFTGLSMPARDIYHRMHKEYRGSKEITTLSYGSLVKAGHNRKMIPYRLFELQVFGFVTIVSHGDSTTANVYKFSDEWKNITKEDVKLIRRKLKKTWDIYRERKEKAKNMIQSEQLSTE